MVIASGDGTWWDEESLHSIVVWNCVQAGLLQWHSYIICLLGSPFCGVQYRLGNNCYTNQLTFN